MSSFESTCFQGLAMLRSSSNVLLEMDDDEMEAQMLLNSTESPTAMKASSYEHELFSHDFS